MGIGHAPVFNIVGVSLRPVDINLYELGKMKRTFPNSTMIGALNKDEESVGWVGTKHFPVSSFG